MSPVGARVPGGRGRLHPIEGIGPWTRGPKLPRRSAPPPRSSPGGSRTACTPALCSAQDAIVEVVAEVTTGATLASVLAEVVYCSAAWALVRHHQGTPSLRPGCDSQSVVAWPPLCLGRCQELGTERGLLTWEWWEGGGARGC